MIMETLCPPKEYRQKRKKPTFQGLTKPFSCAKMTRAKNADVAQSVEQLIRNQQVAGSSPAISSNKKRSPVGGLFLLEQ